MKPSNPVQSMTVYASGSTYRDGPSPAQQAAGMVPLDTLPADWWNWLWEQITTQINNTVAGLGSVYDEILSVLADAEIPASELQVNQLLTAIKAIVQRPGTSGIAGSVKSSTDSGKVAIDADGYMSPNGMGVPTSLNTTAKSIVSAVNEVLATLNAYKTSNDGNITDLQNSKAPNNHASADTTYGAATTSTYGHVKLSDEYEEEQEGTGIAASQAAVAAAYAVLKAAIEGVGGLPATKPSDPLISETGNTDESAKTGTIEIAQAGFYIIEIAGGAGGNGGKGGPGVTTGNTIIGGFGGSVGGFGGVSAILNPDETCLISSWGGLGGGAGAGASYKIATKAPGYIAHAGDLCCGEKVQKMCYLLPGTYIYILGGRGPDGLDGGVGGLSLTNPARRSPLGGYGYDPTANGYIAQAPRGLMTPTSYAGSSVTINGYTYDMSLAGTPGESISSYPGGRVGIPIRDNSLSDLDTGIGTGEEGTLSPYKPLRRILNRINSPYPNANSLTSYLKIWKLI